MKWTALLLLVGCAAPEAPVTRCTIAPVTVSTHDQITPATRRELRRVNRDIQTQCAG